MGNSNGGFGLNGNANVLIRTILVAIVVGYMSWIGYTLLDLKVQTTTLVEGKTINAQRITRLEEVLAIVKERQDERISNFDRLLLRMDRAESLLRGDRPPQN